MPIYEYRCDNGHTFEVTQKMTDDPVATCSTCSAPVQRVFHPVAVHFKGKGFYNTDYGTRRRNREQERTAEDGAAKQDGERKDKPADGAKAAPSSSAAKGEGKPAAKDT